jgi:integrase
MHRKVTWIHPYQDKAKKAIGIPLNADAIQAIRLQIGKHERYVFTYKGNPVLKAGGNAWKKALNRASIENFRWHDLRVVSQSLAQARECLPRRQDYPAKAINCL